MLLGFPSHFVNFPIMIYIKITTFHFSNDVYNFQI